LKTTRAFNELTIQDNFLFERVMRNKRLCKNLIEKILQIKVKDIHYPVSEKTIHTRILSKGIRLDVYVEDDTGRIYDIEMQCTHEKDKLLAKRIRYYESLIDGEHLEKGQSYEELNDTYIIFICTFDPFHEGLPKYTFEPCCRERSSLQLDKGQTDIFLNTKGADAAEDPSLAAFLRYVDGKHIDSMDSFTKELDDEVTKVKMVDQVRREYMLLSDELKMYKRKGKEEGLQEGLKKGRNKGREIEKLNVVKKMFESGLSDDQIMKFTGYTLQDILSCREQTKER
jgi:predicted transposase/invertase (TIGR01784 family)